MHELTIKNEVVETIILLYQVANYISLPSHVQLRNLETRKFRNLFKSLFPVHIPLDHWKCFSHPYMGLHAENVCDKQVIGPKWNK